MIIYTYIICKRKNSLLQPSAEKAIGWRSNIDWQFVGKQLGESWMCISIYRELTWQPGKNEQEKISASVGYCN